VIYDVTESRRAQIESVFSYHPVQPGQKERYEALRAEAREFALMIAAMTPTSREQSLALTALQEAVMYANAAIAINETAQPEESA
jgi:hypothetical protein